MEKTSKFITKKIGWVIAGDKNYASSRLQGFNIHDYLLESGIDSEIIAFNFNKIQTNE